MFDDFQSNNNKNDDFLNEFRQKLADQTVTSFEEKRTELNRSRNVFVGAVSGIVLAGVVGWFVLSPRYAQINSADIPVIRRPQTAIKVQPTEPGGMEILNQDKSVYDILEKKSASENNTVENLLPPPETPQMPVINAETIPEPTNIENIETVNIEENKNSVTVKAQEIIKINEAPKVSAAIVNEQEEKHPTIAEASNTNKIELPQKAEIKIEEAPAPKVEEVASNAPSSASKGDWQVQMMSSPNKKAVEISFASLSKKYSLIKNLPNEVEVADLGAKGTYYRLQVGAFKDKKEADTLCKDLKALGGTCIVKKK